MISAMEIVKRGYSMFTRVFPRCSMISQAIAFNFFLAFFPALLIAVALAGTRIGGKASLLEIVQDLTEFLPPGSRGLVSEFLVSLTRGMESRATGVVGHTAGGFAGDEAGDGRNSHYLWRRREARIPAPAASWLAAVADHVCSFAQCGSSGNFGQTTAALDRARGRKHSILQGWWSNFFPVAAKVLAMLSLTV